MICVVCNKEKKETEFYSHKGMKSGKLSKCKECCKEQSKKNYERKIMDPSFIEKERKRGREKAKKYNYRASNRSSILSKYKSENKEKILARSKTSKMKAPKGFQNHHWSYKESDHLDVIVLEHCIHSFSHRFLVYDKESMKYRTITQFKKFPSGYLLDTRQEHEEYISFCLKRFEK